MNHVDAGEVEEQLVEDTLEPFPVPLALLRRFKDVGKNGGPGVHRRVNIAKIPFVRWNLAVAVGQAKKAFLEDGVLAVP